MPIYEDSRTTLLIAAWKGQTATVEALLSKNMDVNAKDKAGATALLYAAFNGHTSVVQTLLSKGADVNAKDVGGRTALFYASLNGHTETVQALLSNGADVNSPDEGGRAPLLVAESQGHTGIAQLLRRAGGIQDLPRPLEREIKEELAMKRRVVYLNQTCRIGGCRNAAVQGSEYCTVHKAFSYRVRSSVTRTVKRALAPIRFS